jgi:chemotaxis protein MotB
MADENNNQTIIIKKIKKGGHGHHGGAWKVAYADFVTAMMAFFLTMWIMGMSQDQKKGIQDYFNDPLKYLFGTPKVFSGVFSGSVGDQMVNTSEGGGSAAGHGKSKQMHFLADTMTKWFKPFDGDVTPVKIYPDRVQFAITAESLFSPGSILLKRDSQPVLDRVAEVLKSVDSYVMIEAHTDDLKVESPQYATNWELSAMRAATVVRYFVEGHYLDPSKITAMAAAEYRPIADNSTPEGRAKNRRIDIYVIPEKEGLFNIRAPAAEQELPEE